MLETPRGGTWGPHVGGQGSRQAFTYRELEAFLTTLELRAGKHLRRTFDRHETAVLLATPGLLVDGEGVARSPRALGVALAGQGCGADLTNPPSRRRIAAELPGIGIAKLGRGG